MIKAVTYILENNSTVQGIVGLRSAGTDYKVFPVVVPQSEKAPYIAVRLSGKTSLGKDCGYTYTVEVVSYHTSYDDVTTLNAAVISALTGQAGATVNGVAFGALNFSNESDDFVKDHGLYAKVTSFEGWAD